MAGGGSVYVGLTLAEAGWSPHSKSKVGSTLGPQLYIPKGLPTPVCQHPAELPGNVTGKGEE